MNNWVLLFWLIQLFWLPSCEKENFKAGLDGNNDLLLSKADPVSGVYIAIANQKGIAMFPIKMDFSCISESLKLKALNFLPKFMQYNKITNLKTNLNQEVNYMFNQEIISDWNPDYPREENSLISTRLNDKVGTGYTITHDIGQQNTRIIWEKTDSADWLLGFNLIKTMLYKLIPPTDNPIFNKVSYRLNHSLGLVYLEFEIQDRYKLDIDIYAFHV